MAPVRRFQVRLWMVVFLLFLPGGMLILVTAFQALDHLSRDAAEVVQQLERERIEALTRHSSARLVQAARRVDAELDRPSQMLLQLALQLEGAYANGYRPALPGDHGLKPGAPGTWLQNDSGRPTALLVQSYLQQQGKPLAAVGALLDLSAVLDWVMPGLVAEHAYVQALYFVGPPGASFLRIAPWTDIGPNTDLYYPKQDTSPYWSTYFPGLVEFWLEALTDSAPPASRESLLVVSETYLDAATGQPVQTFFCPAIDWRTGRLLGVICADLRQDSLDASLSLELPGAARKEAVVLLLDADGRFLSSSPGAGEVLGATFKAGAGGLITQDFDPDGRAGWQNWRQWTPENSHALPLGGETWHATALPLKERCIWHQGVVQKTPLFLLNLQREPPPSPSAGLAVQTVRKSRDILLLRLLLVLGLILLALGLGLWLATSHVAPSLKELVEVTRSMMRGDFTRRATIRSRDEFALLAQAIHRTAETLEASFQQNQRQTGQLEEEIRQHQLARRDQRRLVLAFEHAAEALAITDEEGSLLHLNPAFAQDEGRPSETLLGSKAWIFRALDEGGAPQELAQSLGSRGQWSGRMSREDGFGRQRLLDLTISAFRDEEGTTRNFVLISRDVTQLVELEKRLQQAQKLESIGTLAGGIAHDFNNLLTPILGLSDLLLNDAAGSEVIAKPAREIHEAAARARDLVRQILTFARDLDTPKVAVDVNREVEEVAQLLRAILPATIELVVSPSPEPAWTMMGPAQLHQVMMNLATNAFHAMEEKGGKLQLNVLREIHGPESSGHIHLVVEDSGPGVPMDIQGRIFDPFFSTKGKSKGTGLGLASVHGIVQSMGGRIWLSPAVPHGACFHIVLPACSPQLAEGHRRQPYQTGQNTGSIALVDDEAQVLEFSELALTRLGYKVKSFSDARECLEWLARDGSEVDLLITDQTMPHLTGLQLIEKVRILRPRLKVLLVTGYSQDALNGLQQFAHGSILHKPYHLNELAEAVQNLLLDQP